MRKISLLFAALMTTATIAWAQVGTLTVRAKGEIERTASGFDFLYGDTTSFIVKQCVSGFFIGMKESHELVRYDMNLDEQKRSTMTLPPNFRYITGFDNKEVVDILLTKRDEDNKLTVYHDKFSATTLEPIGEPVTIASLTGEKTDNLVFISRQSPDKQLTAGIFVTKREGQASEARVSLYDRHLEEYWTMSTRLNVVDFASVTDSGEVIIGGWLQQKVTGKSDFEIIVLDGENNRTYHFTVDAGTLAEVDFANYHDGKLYFFAIGRKKGSRNTGWSDADRVISICYNTISNQATLDSHSFSEDELDYMNNHGDFRGTSSSELRFLGIDNMVAAPDGHYDVLLTQTWKMVGDINAGVCSGIMIATVKPDGTIKRVYTRPYAILAAQAYVNMKKYRMVRANGGSLLLYSQNEKNIDRKFSKKAKKLTYGSDLAVLTAIFVPDEGEIREQHFDNGGYNLMGSPIALSDGRFLLFLRTNKKLQSAIFSLQ